jgi:hypothetical protein
MSVTRQEPVAAGIVPAGNDAGPSGEVAHYDGENPPSAGPLRELIDDRLLDALLERSKDAAGGCG